MPRYAAKLLFVWDREPDGVQRARPLCEERIVTLRAGSAKAALAKVKRMGRRENADYVYTATFGPSRFRFLGVLQLLDLEFEPPHEVWWELHRRFRPALRKSKLLPPQSDLWAIKDARLSRGARRRPRLVAARQKGAA
jgi:hypothetical protein